MGAFRDAHNKRMAKIFEQQRSRQMTEEREMTDKEHEEYIQSLGKQVLDRIDKDVPEIAKMQDRVKSSTARTTLTRDLVTGNVSYILAVLEISCTKPEVLAICNKKLAELRDLALKS